MVEAHIHGDSETGPARRHQRLSMCTIHHAAHDRRILGVHPDYRIAVRDDVLFEVDGPMLRHGFQEMRDTRLQLPERVADLPDRGATSPSAG